VIVLRRREVGDGLVADVETFGAQSVECIAEVDRGPGRISGFEPYLLHSYWLFSCSSVCKRTLGHWYAVRGMAVFGGIRLSTWGSGPGLTVSSSSGGHSWFGACGAGAAR